MPELRPERSQNRARALDCPAPGPKRPPGGRRPRRRCESCTAVHERRNGKCKGPIWDPSTPGRRQDCHIRGCAQGIGMVTHLPTRPRPPLTNRTTPLADAVRRTRVIVNRNPLRPCGLAPQPRRGVHCPHRQRWLPVRRGACARSRSREGRDG